VALFGWIRAWNYSAETARSAVGCSLRSAEIIGGDPHQIEPGDPQLIKPGEMLNIPA